LTTYEVDINLLNITNAARAAQESKMTTQEFVKSLEGKTWTDADHARFDELFCVEKLARINNAKTRKANFEKAGGARCAAAARDSMNRYLSSVDRDGGRDD
jgi:hypothetical protein